MRRRRLDLVAALAALLLLGLVVLTAGLVAAQGDTQIVLAAVHAQGQVASATALETTRAILVERLGALRSLFTQPPNVQIVTTGERQQLVVDVHLASAITPSQVVMNLLRQVPQMVRDGRWSFHLPADNDRRSRLQEVMNLLRQGQFSIPARRWPFLAAGSSTAGVPVLVSSKDIAPWSIRVAPHIAFHTVGPPSIVFTLYKAASARLARYMSTSPGKMAVALDHIVVDPPAIAIDPRPFTRSLPTGALELLCSGGERQMQTLVILLKYGPTPTELKIVSVH